MSSSPMVAGKYELLRRLGKGGMAEVFLAKQTGMEGFEKLVVVKRILPQLADNDDFVTMFLDEARTAADLRHGNVVSIFEVDEDDGTYFIAMEFLHGKDIRTIQRQSVQAKIPIPLAHTLQIVLDAASGLHYAHAKATLAGEPLNIVHRDVSPQNILVTYEGATKIVDFGIAKAATQNTETQTGVVKGKYTYMAPEQAAGEVLDHRTDQFALGIVLWELVTMRRLFKRESEIMTLAAISEGDVPRPSEFVPGLPPKLEAIMMKALERRREDRFANCQELAMALEDFLAESRMVHSPARLGQFMRELFADTLRDETDLGVGQLDGQSLSQVGLERTNPQRRPRNRTMTPISIVMDDEASAPSDQTAMTPRTSSRAVVAQKNDESETPSTRGGGTAPGQTTPRARTSTGAGAGVVTALANDHARDGSRRTMLAALAGVVAFLVIAGGLFAALFLVDDFGQIMVRTEPAGATVFWNGVKTGDLTPAIIRDVPVGDRQRVRVELDGYDAFDFEGMIARDGDRLELETTLEVTSADGKKPVVVGANGAGKKIDDEKPVIPADAPVTASGVGAASTEKENDEGSAVGASSTTEAKKSDDADADKTKRDTKREKQTRANSDSKKRDTKSTTKSDTKSESKTDAKPDTTPAQLKVVAKPWAKVYVDGKFLDTTPFPSKKIPPGVHEIKLMNPDLKKEKVERINMSAGETYKVNVDWR